MAANDEIPRGLALTSSPAIGAGASITFPATPGIAWIVTEINGGIYSNGGANGATGIAVNGTTLGGTLMALDVAAGVSGSDNASWSGSIAGSPGAALTVTTSAIASAGQFLTATAYPI